MSFKHPLIDNSFIIVLISICLIFQLKKITYRPKISPNISVSTMCNRILDYLYFSVFMQTNSRLILKRAPCHSVEWQGALRQVSGNNQPDYLFSPVFLRSTIRFCSMRYRWSGTLWPCWFWNP